MSKTKRKEWGDFKGRVTKNSFEAVLSMQTAQLRDKCFVLVSSYICINSFCIHLKHGNSDYWHIPKEEIYRLYLIDSLREPTAKF